MKYPLFQVDAFADELFKGNPAAVVPLPAWLDDAVLQAIALENNLSETAFMVAQDDGFGLRWFTPSVEVDLCGHATLAAAHVLRQHLDCYAETIRFHTRSGELSVTEGEFGLTLDFPARTIAAINVDVGLCDALGAVASEAFDSENGSGPLLLVYEFEQDVAGLAPDFNALQHATTSNVIVTAPGDDCDFVSRFFAPQVGINEDPVTGSAHCSLVPYWAARLGKTALRCRQISSRGGELWCEADGDRVSISGKAMTYLQGEISL